MCLGYFTNKYTLIIFFSFYQWHAVQEDYIVVNSQVIFSSGSRLGDISCGSVFIINDNTAEINEDFFLNLTSQSPAVAEINSTLSRQTVFIRDDDGIHTVIHCQYNTASYACRSSLHVHVKAMDRHFGLEVLRH